MADPYNEYNILSNNSGMLYNQEPSHNKQAAFFDRRPPMRNSIYGRMPESKVIHNYSIDPTQATIGTMQNQTILQNGSVIVPNATIGAIQNQSCVQPPRAVVVGNNSMMTNSLAMQRNLSNSSLRFLDNNSLVHGQNGLRHSVVHDNMHGSNVLGYNTRHGGVHDNIIGGTTVIGGDIMPGHTSKVVRGGNIVYEGQAPNPSQAVITERVMDPCTGNILLEKGELMPTSSMLNMMPDGNMKEIDLHLCGDDYLRRVHAKWQPSTQETTIIEENQFMKLEVYDLKEELKKKNVEAIHMENMMKGLQKQLFDWYNSSHFKHYDLHQKEVEQFYNAEKHPHAKTMDYRSEVICKLNDIIRFKDDEQITTKHDLIKLNDTKSFDDNIKQKEDIREKGNQIVRLLLKVALMQNRLDHVEAGNLNFMRKANQDGHYKSNVFNSGDHTQNSHAHSHGSRVPNMDNGFDRTSNQRFNYNNSANPDFNPNVTMSNKTGCNDPTKFQEEYFEGDRYNNHSEFRFTNNNHSELNPELKEKDGQHYTRSQLFNDFNKNRAKSEFDRQDGDYYNSYKDKRYIELEEKILRLEEDIKIMQTQLILKDKEILKMKNDTVDWYEDSIAQTKYGHQYHFASGDFLKDLQEFRRDELKLMRENKTLKSNIWDLKRRVDHTEIENELLRNELMAQRELDLLNVNLYRNKSGNFTSYEKEGVLYVDEFKVIHDCDKFTIPCGWLEVDQETLYFNWQFYQDSKDKLTKDNVYQVRIKDSILNLVSDDIYHECYLKLGKNYWRANSILIYRGKRTHVHATDHQQLYECLHRYEARNNALTSLCDRRQEDVMKIRKHLVDLENHKEMRINRDADELVKKNKEIQHFIDHCLQHWRNDNVHIHNVERCEPVARYIRELQKQANLLEDHIKRKDVIIDNLLVKMNNELWIDKWDWEWRYNFAFYEKLKFGTKDLNRMFSYYDMYDRHHAMHTGYGPDMYRRKAMSVYDSHCSSDSSSCSMSKKSNKSRLSRSVNFDDHDDAKRRKKQMKREKKDHKKHHGNRVDKFKRDMQYPGGMDPSKLAHYNPLYDDCNMRRSVKQAIDSDPRYGNKSRHGETVIDPTYVDPCNTYPNDKSHPIRSSTQNVRRSSRDCGPGNSMLVSQAHMDPMPITSHGLAHARPIDSFIQPSIHDSRVAPGHGTNVSY